jgi:hypothetical protein
MLIFDIYNNFFMLILGKGWIDSFITNPSCDLHHCFFNAVSQDKKKNLQFKAMRGDSMNIATAI